MNVVEPSYFARSSRGCTASRTSPEFRDLKDVGPVPPESMIDGGIVGASKSEVMMIGSETLLIAEDGLEATRALASYLTDSGYNVDARSSREEAALYRCDMRRYDAIVIAMPSRTQDGISLRRKMRSELRLAAPIFLISGCGTLETKLEVFQGGADDFLLMPISASEVELRIRNRVHRYRGRSRPETLRVGDLVLDPCTQRVERGGVAIRLTPTGFRILKHLMLASPRIVTRDEIIREIWRDGVPQSDALRSHLYAVRKQVNRRSWAPLLRTVRNTGFQLVPTRA